MGRDEGRGGGRDEQKRRMMDSWLPLGEKGLRVEYKSRAKQTFRIVTQELYLTEPSGHIFLSILLMKKLCLRKIK